MQAPKLPAMLSLFRQRPLRGFDYTPRYYDPAAEARRERSERARAQGMGTEGLRREEMRERLRHGWQRRQGSRVGSLRLLAALALACMLAFVLYQGLRLFHLR